MTTIRKSIAAAAFLGALGAAGLAAAGEGRMGGHGPRGVDFGAIDADGNGALSRAELTARAVERLGAVDANGDGALDRAELVAAAPARRGFGDVFGVDPAEEMADRTLAAQGATAAGRVEVAALAEDRVNGLLTHLDEDRDDALSRTEAEAGGDRRAERRGHGDRPRF